MADFFKGPQRCTYVRGLPSEPAWQAGVFVHISCRKCTVTFLPSTQPDRLWPPQSTHRTTTSPVPNCGNLHDDDGALRGCAHFLKPLAEGDIDCFIYQRK